MTIIYFLNSVNFDILFGFPILTFYHTIINNEFQIHDTTTTFSKSLCLFKNFMFSIDKYYFGTRNQTQNVRTMNVADKLNVLLPFLCFSLMVNRAKSVSFDKEPCIIRFYDRQYFMGNFWSLHSNGTWTSSRSSLFRTPYRSFEMKSMRVYGLRTCRWQICPLRTRRNFSLPRWKKCEIAKGGKILSSLRAWGWPYNIIGNVLRLPDKRPKYEETDSIKFGSSNRFFTTDQQSSTKKEGMSTIKKHILP